MQLTPKKVLALIGILIVLLVGWFGWQLFGPAPAIVVSKATTYITAPLRPDGLPDYERYVLEKMRDGVTPENNAAVLCWQAMGPGEMPAEDFALLAKEIGLDKLPANDECLEVLSGRENRERVVAWLRERGTLPPDDEEPFDRFGDEPWTDADETADALIYQAIDCPWTSQQIPPLAEWVKDNEKAIDLLAAASKRPRFYSPSVELLNDKPESVLFMSLAGIQSSRDAVRALAVRAMWNLGEGRDAQAWADLLAMYRLSRLVGEGNTLIEQLVSIAIEGIADQSTLAVLNSPSLSPDLAMRIRKDLMQLPLRNSMSVALDQTERIGGLSAVINLRNGNLHELGMDDGVSQAAMATAFDWNVPLSELNLWYDELSAAAKLPSWVERQQALEAFENRLKHTGQSPSAGRIAGAFFSRNVRSQFLSDIFAALMLPATSAACAAEDRANTLLTLTQLAAAIAQYRAQHGEYPDKLEAIVPDILPQLPVDLYHDNPFAYRRTKNGFLLYSFGPNGKDDAGSSQEMSDFKGYSTGIEPAETLYKLLDDDLPADFDAADELSSLDDHIPQDADDIAIRVPLPKLELPQPPKPEETAPVEQLTP